MKTALNFLSRPKIDTLRSLAFAAIFALCAYYLINGSVRWAVMISGVMVALALYFFRMRFRLAYGFAEVSFALSVLWDATGKGRGAFSSDFSSDFDTFNLSVVLAETVAAIYVLIRGLDNCHQGLPKAWSAAIDSAVRKWPR